jgi:glycosyltransferase involved in cell wall biosynthesis
MINFQHSVWFIVPDVDFHAGGINQIYKICQLFNEIGINSKVLSAKVYPHADPIDIQKNWQEYHFNYHIDYPEIKEGDIVVQPEVWHWRLSCNVPIRRVTWIQGWALAHTRNWQNHYWIINNGTHTTFILDAIYNKISEVRKNTIPIDIPWNIWNTSEFIKKDKVNFSNVTPFLDKNDFIFNTDSDKIIIFNRKTSDVFNIILEKFGDKVIVVENKTPEEVRKIMTKGGIFVLSSPAEGICLPALEAIFSGTVVVSWPCGGPEEYLIDEVSAMMVEPGDINGMIDKIQYLLDNPDRRKEIAKNAYELVSDLYTEEKTKKELYFAYFNSIKLKPEL